MGDLRHETDVAANMPKWFISLAMKIGRMERGRVYNLLIIVPDSASEPTWSVIGDSKIENQR